MNIITNNHPRNLTYGYELSPKERENFDYITDENMMNHDFLRYRGQLYDMHDFMHVDHELKDLGWQGIITDSYFSGIVIKYTDDNIDQVIVGMVLS